MCLYLQYYEAESNLAGYTGDQHIANYVICEPNKQKRLEFAQANLHYSFETVIFTDETTVQLESHRRYCYQKTGEKPHLIIKPRPKHPTKVYLWAGIIKSGPTGICIFEGMYNGF